METIVANITSKVRLPNWCPSNRKEQYEIFATLFPKITRNLDLDNESMWQSWFNEVECEKHFPSMA